MTKKASITYVGSISPHTKEYSVRIHAQHGASMGTSALPLRLELRNHSPTGFCWGYMGSGPSQLALAILAHHLHNKERALALYQSFKEQVIARLPKDDSFQLTGEQVGMWVKKATEVQAAKVGVGK